MISHVEKVFNSIPKMIGEKFVYSKINTNLRSREIAPVIELLSKGGIKAINLFINCSAVSFMLVVPSLYAFFNFRKTFPSLPSSILSLARAPLAM